MIIDAHVHVGDIRFLGKYRSYITYLPESLGDTFGPEILLKSMDELGIDKSVVFATKTHGLDFALANEEVARMVSSHEDRLIGFAVINPLQANKAVEELKRCAGDLGLKGVKLHPLSQGYRIYGAFHDSLVDLVVGEATKLKLPIIIHSGSSVFSHPLHIALLANAFPEVPIIIAHFGSSPESYGFTAEDALSAAKMHRNIFLETSKQPTLIIIKKAVETVGAERVIFGTDTPFGVPDIELKKIKAMRLSEDQERLILGGNIARILGIEVS